MARPLRIEYPGAVYHVTARGNARRDIYRDDDDRRAFLDTLARAVQRMGWRCHAYCLMENHYHLVVETPQGNLSRGMRQLNGVYAQDFNRRYRSIGHVFQGRFCGVLVDRDAYLVELSRYVVLNPVRGGIVRRAGDWEWSSYRATAGLATAPAWLHTDWVLAQFGPSFRIARAAFRRFVGEGTEAGSVWRHLRHQIYLGDEAFVRRMQEKIDSDQDLSEVPRPQRLPEARSLDEYAALGTGQKKSMVLAYQSGGYALAQIARHFGVHYSTVSRAVKGSEGKNT
jgi:putative transposase